MVSTHFIQLIMIVVCFPQSTYSKSTTIPPLGITPLFTTRINNEDLCLNGSIDPEIAYRFIIGRYTWSSFNPNTNSSVYVCDDCMDYDLYFDEYMFSGKLYWRIGRNVSKPNLFSYCGLANNNIFEHGCIGNWLVWHSETAEWVYYPDLIMSECSDKIQPSPPPDDVSDICVSGGEESVLYGTYIWNTYNPVFTNSSVYFCEECSVSGAVYLYENRLYGNRHWTIGPSYMDPARELTWHYAYCELRNIDITDGCAGYWKRVINSEHVLDDSMRVDVCNDTATPLNKENVCLNGSMDLANSQNTNKLVIGTYKWASFNPNTNSSVYVCDDCTNEDIYFYEYTFDDGNSAWFIGINVTKTTNIRAYCELPNNNIFQYGCIGNWKIWHPATSEWVYYPQLIMSECSHKTEYLTPPDEVTDICVSGDFNESVSTKILYGTYRWITYNPIFPNSSVYFCEECVATRAVYLYEHVFDARRYWIIGRSYMDPVRGSFWQFAYCELFITDISKDNCLGYWKRVIKPGSPAVLDENMRADICNVPTINVTIHLPTTSRITTNWTDTTTSHIIKITASSSTGYYYFLYTQLGIVCFWGFICLIAAVDAKYFRQNDFFKPVALFFCALDMLDILGDISFTVDTHSKYKHQMDDFYKAQLLIIVIASGISVIGPITMSVGQLYCAARKWLKDDIVKEWFLRFDKLLYITSFITGSAFSAVELYNSNILGLYIFDMCLYRKHSLKFNNKKLYSIVYMENLPQIVLKIWAGILIGFTLISLMSMTWSVVSIVVTVITMFQRKKIEATQGCLVITFDVIAKDEIIQVEKCQNRIGKIQSALSVIFGINKRLLEIQKPEVVPRGLQVVVNIAMNDVHHDFEARNFKGLLKEASCDQSLQHLFQNEWGLKKCPTIENINCIKFKSKQKEVNEGENVVIELSKTAGGWISVGGEQHT